MIDSTDTPEKDFQPTTQEELQRFLRLNYEDNRQTLTPIGGRTELHLGFREGTQKNILLSGLDRIVDFPARDMTVTVESGVKIDSLSEQLQQEGLQLPVDVAQSHRATVGGIVATNTFGSHRFGYGSLRDYVIGMTAIDGMGRMFHSGGRVVKNVAGYDLCKLMTGSQGTLGVITQVTFKLRPLPESRGVLWMACEDHRQVDALLECVATLEIDPISIDVLNKTAARQIVVESRADVSAESPIVVLGVEGSENSADYLLRFFKNKLDPYFRSVNEFRDENSIADLYKALIEYRYHSDEPITFRIAIPSSKLLAVSSILEELRVGFQCYAGCGVLFGHSSDRIASAAEARELISAIDDFCRYHSGSVAILQCESDWKPDLKNCMKRNGTSSWNRKIKQALDPANLLNPGLFEFGNQS